MCLRRERVCVCVCVSLCPHLLPQGHNGYVSEWVRIPNNFRSKFSRHSLVGLDPPMPSAIAWERMPVEGRSIVASRFPRISLGPLIATLQEPIVSSTVDLWLSPWHIAVIWLHTECPTPPGLQQVQLMCMRDDSTTSSSCFTFHCTYLQGVPFYRVGSRHR